MNEARLALPSSEEMILVARMTTSGIAARAGLSIEGVEDMKLAADEAFRALLLQNAAFSAVAFVYRFSDGCMELTAEGIGGTKTEGDYHPDVLLQMLGELCGEAEVRCEKGVLLSVTVKSHA